MIGTGHIAGLAAAISMIVIATPALAQRSAYEALIAAHAKANHVPESLVHRVVMRESRYNASLIGHGGVIGLMQIKLLTARGVGYTGDAEGLRDPATNIAYGVRYLAGAWRLANGSEDRAVSLYAHGYYYEEKHAHLPPMHFAALPLATPTPDDNATDVDSTEPPAPALYTDATDVDPVIALHGHIPLPRPRPQLPGDPVATAAPRAAPPPNSFSDMWNEITRLLPASH
jgi:hypothetical protein